MQCVWSKILQETSSFFLLNLMEAITGVVLSLLELISIANDHEKHPAAIESKQRVQQEQLFSRYRWGLTYFKWPKLRQFKTPFRFPVMSKLNDGLKICGFDF